MANSQGKIVVVGAGGHAKVIIDCLRWSGWDVIGCTGAPGSPDDCAGVPVVGTDDRLPTLLDEGIRHAFCAVGDNSLREQIGKRLSKLGFEQPRAIGQGAIISPSVVLGEGVAVMPGAVINAHSIVGSFSIINTNSSVDHDGRIGQAVHIAPGAALAGEVEVGDRAFVGTGSSIIPKVIIGPDSTIGAGSVVIRNLPSSVLAFGNPAKIQRVLA